MLYHTITAWATTSPDSQTQTKINVNDMMISQEQDVFNCLPCQWSPDC